MITLPPNGGVVVCYGAGVDSTAMLVAMHRQGLRPDLITTADTGGEKPETYAYAERMDVWLASVGFPPITWCRKVTLPTTPYDDLEGNNTHNTTLPSLAFGMKSCSIKWKQGPQDQYLKGSQAPHNPMPAHPLWGAYKAGGAKIVKLIGYDDGPADQRRSKRLKTADDDFSYVYPLQQLGWAREECIRAIVEEGLPVPLKSSCWFCPASQKWEIFWLAGTHPDLFLRALEMEHGALTGRHSRWDGDLGKWADVIRGDTFPSAKGTVGLGRKFAWSFYAREQGIVDRDGNIKASPAWLLARSAELKNGGGNASDTALVRLIV